jgi:quercetin dioxygenase-like cupin family protein
MDVIRGGTSGDAKGGRFTGDVRLEMLREAPSPDVPDVARIHHAGGAVTRWHEHPGGQVLYVLDGLARAGTADETWHELEPGTLLVVPASERHWHGAAAGGACTLLSLAWGTTLWEDAAPELDT